MSIIDRYIVKEVVRVLVILVIGLVILFYLVDFFEKIDKIGRASCRERV